MKYSLYLGKVSGIKISIHWTFLILILWIVLGNLRRGSDINEIMWSVGFVLTIFVCVILHELGHALAAQRFNIKTRDIIILPIGGVAQLESMPEKPKEELIVALAGPLVNFIISAALFPFVKFSSEVGELDLNGIGPSNFLPALMSINIWLALFNLIPAFPMDGGRVLRALLGFKLSHAKATRIAATVGQVLAIAFVFFGFMSNPFLIFIGLFIFLGAQTEATYSESKLLLKGFTVNDVTMREIPTIDEGAPIKEAVLKLLNSQTRNYLVTKAGEPVGTLSREQIIKALAEKGEGTYVRELDDKDLVILESEMPLEHAWRLMQERKKPLMPVMANGHLIGVVDDENIAEFILIRTAESRYNTLTESQDRPFEKPSIGNWRA
jgi:Zn-dependent protease/predicted transcriptional regulator